MCPNRVCPGRQWQLLKHFVSRGAMDIDGLGEKQVHQLQQAGLVTTAADFYRLTPEQLLELEGYGEISRATASCRTSPTRASARSAALLFAIGLEEVGFVTGRNLAQRFRSIDALLAAERGGDRARRRASGRRWRSGSTSSSPTSRCAR